MNNLDMKHLNIYKNKKVFITGNTGFKGSWLVKVLSLLGARIKGYALEPNTEPSLFNILNIEDLCEASIIGDIRDKDKLKKELIEFQPDFVFHLAAQPIVLRSYQEPLSTFETNIMGTTNLLEAIREMNKPDTYSLIITTDKVYKNIEKTYAYKEEDQLGGYDPYSASKAGAELVVSSYRDSFFNPKNYDKHKNKIASLRAGNVIGGGDWAENRLLPDIIRSISKDEEIIIRSPNAIRPWQHVLEPLFGYLYIGYLLSETDGFVDSLNFGPNIEDCINVESVVDMSIRIWGKGSYRAIQKQDSPHEAGLLMLDISKAKDLGWTPKWDAYTALKKTVNWYNVFYDSESHANLDNYTINQINSYING